MACMCAETFAAECGCGSKAAEDTPIPSDPRVSPMNDGLHIPADSPALDLPRENAEIGGVDFKADSSPLPPDPRVSPLNEGLYTPSDTPEMAAESDKTAIQVSMGSPSGSTKSFTRIFNLYVRGVDDDLEHLTAELERLLNRRVQEWNATWDAESFGAESAFDRLEDEVADEYEEKGMSDKEAQRIGAAVAYEQGVKKYGKKIMSEAARKGVSARSLERRAEVGAHVPTRIAATTTPRGVVKTYDSIPAGDGHVVGQFTPNMDYAPSGMYGAESITDSISKGFGSVLGIMSGLIIGGFAMNAVALLKSDDEN